MRPDKVVRLCLNGALSQRVGIPRDYTHKDAEIVGFDTEWTVRGKLLAWSLWTGHGGVVLPRPLGLRALRDACRSLGCRSDEIVLATFFSPVELQWLHVARDADRLFESGSRSLDARFKIDGTTLWVIDLARWYPGQSLAKVALAHGAQKLDLPDIGSLKLTDFKREDFQRYALRDAEVTWRVAVQLRGEAQALGEDLFDSRTPATLGSRAWRRSLSGPLAPPHARCRYVALRSAWGGRNEAIVRGRFAHAHYYDFSSCYPRAAASFEVLPRAEDWKEGRSLQFVREAIGGFGLVSFEFPGDCAVPCLPVLRSGLLVFPLRGRSWCSFDEIKIASELGARVSLVEGWGFFRGIEAFSDWQRRLLERRQESTSEVERALLKSIGNAAVGKLAQAIEDFTLEDMRRTGATYGLSLEDIGKMTNEELSILGVRKRLSLGSTHLPEWFSLITGRARAWLARAANQTKALYLATDGLWTPSEWKDAPEGVREIGAAPATVARARLAALWSDPPVIAGGGFYSRKVAADALAAFTGGPDVEIDYGARSMVGIREALRVRTMASFAKFRQLDLHGSTRWDGKRELLEDGSTRAWATVSEFDRYHASRSLRKKEIEFALAPVVGCSA